MKALAAKSFLENLGCPQEELKVDWNVDDGLASLPQFPPFCLKGIILQAFSAPPQAQDGWLNQSALSVLCERV